MSGAAKSKQRAVPLPDDDPDVNRWRHQHNQIERVAAQFTDANGSIGDPYHAVGLLASMERNGRINPEKREAGEKFHELFVCGGHQSLRAADPARIGSSGWRPPAYRGSGAAQDAVHEALVALGDPGASCAWFVLGAECSLTQWAARRRWGGQPIRTEHATGILIGALGMLEKMRKDGWGDRHCRSLKN